MWAMSELAGKQFNKDFGLDFNGATKEEVEWAFGKPHEEGNLSPKDVQDFILVKWGVSYKDNGNDYPPAKSKIKKEILLRFNNGQIIPTTIKQTNVAEYRYPPRLIQFLEEIGWNHVKNVMAEHDKAKLAEKQKQKEQLELEIEERRQRLAELG